MYVCKYLKQRVRREQVNKMENLSRVFQKQKKKKKTLEETEYHNSIPD